MRISDEGGTKGPFFYPYDRESLEYPDLPAEIEK